MNDTPPPKRKYFIRTYGCQMNVHDSERMSGLLDFDGYEPVSDPEEADLLIANTCAVREKPERKLLAELGRWKRLKRKKSGLVIAVSGCQAPRDADLIRARAPWVDLLLGPRSLYRLPELVRQVELQRYPLDSVDLFDDPTPLTPTRRSNLISAWVDVMFGCNYSCTFCAVPTARGGEVSRKTDDILDEIRELKLLGYKEITLLGQTVNAWGRDWHFRNPYSVDIKDLSLIKNLAPPFHSLPLSGGEKKGGYRRRIDFAWLLEQIDQTAPGMRVRFTSPHPRLFNDRLIKAIAELPTVCEHVHLPLQSADNAVLRRMKRAYTYEQYCRIVDKLRRRIPDISLTTDIIVGFPGESEAQFHKTLKAVSDLSFDQAFMFIYSPRRLTEALKYESEAVTPEAQKARLQELIEAANAQFNAKNRSQVEKIFEVLVDGESEKNPDRLSGRTRGNKVIVFAGKREMIGQLVQVQAKIGYLWGFAGEVVP
ncbi:MAG: radical SAM protein [Calditrichota bacterium]